MKKVYCLDCSETISIPNNAKVGDETACDDCGAEFELVKLSPPVIEWLFDDEWDDDEFDDDELDDDELDDDDDDGFSTFNDRRHDNYELT